MSCACYKAKFVAEFVMDKKMTIRHLESLSYFDLFREAELHGIDVPEKLNRRFLIAEILDAIENEAESKSVATEMAVNNSAVAMYGKLPESYNTTEISLVLQNPMWAFVFWNISNNDFDSIKAEDSYAFSIKICSFDSREAQNMIDFFDVKADDVLKEQYVLLPVTAEFISAELNVTTKNGERTLARSAVIERQMANDEFLQCISVPGKLPELSPIMKLSGTEKLLRKSYKIYRQLFS